MTPAGLVAVWVIAGILGAAIGRATRHFRAAWWVLGLVMVAGLLMPTGSGWPGPASSTSGEGNLMLGRPGMGLLVAAAIAVALTSMLSPHVDGGELLATCVVGAACTVLLSATVPLIWGCAAAVAVGALAVRWIAVAPGRATLAGGRIGGVGASCMLGAASFVPPAGAPLEPRAVLSGSLLGVGMCCLLALVPFGGWAAGAAGVLRGIDLAPWGLLLAPTLVISSMSWAPQLALGGRIPFDNSLLVLGLVTVVVGGVAALRVPANARYGRLLIADMAFAAAGVGTTHAEGLTGAYIIVLSHLCVAPLLLQGSRVALRAQSRLAWLAVSGVPPTPAFWGRYLVLVGCTATAPAATAAGLAGATLLFFAAVERAVDQGDGDGGDAGTAAQPPTALQRAAAWSVAIAAAALGLAPSAVAHGVFGL